mmetsp:Transcript_5411/g.6846  ORF Transcript_5411/g.6846 Transcript_5411/m.6846 type:complete len:412 (-) Transcript_5411:796-2031(-)|eukprot:CAMPEP_0204845506 /NCGR_PEP_ID=MMETSP1347-20130617/1226_1 /ASSEMBLY_ACC=CAM_ASM_000690 /TAXON_ID=215587 /ORGANISM="Aplanochytrium stocchinoi, Strain GSBS06" /LENGTH=411 /DNA_ID=CAMNT_0051985615 /DNA_START=81 /DNA_END=1316 /DNA_ORIENTATION=-
MDLKRYSSENAGTKDFNLHSVDQLQRSLSSWNQDLSYVGFDPSVETGAVYRSVKVSGSPVSSFFLGYPQNLSLPVAEARAKKTASSFTSRVCERNINTLFWKYENYPVSLHHGFVPANIESSLLFSNIESSLSALNIDFLYDARLGGYRCEVTKNSTCISFNMHISELQHGCQKQHGARYVVEIRKISGTSCPSVWERVLSQIFRKLSDIINLNVVDPVPARLKGTHTSSFHAVESEIPRTDGNLIVSSFIDLLDVDVGVGKVNETTIQIAEILAGLTGSKSTEYNEKWMREKDIDKLVSLLNSENKDLSRCACTIVANAAAGGLLCFDSDSKLDILLRAIIRKLNIVDAKDVFLLELQREALRALVAISKIYQPTGFVRTMATSTLKRCSNSADQRVSGYAGQGLSIYCM